MSEREGHEVAVPEGAGTIGCPRCGRRQPAAAECAFCGVVLAKYRAERPSPMLALSRRPAGAPALPPKPSEPSALPWLLAALFVVAVTAFALRELPSAALEPAPMPAERLAAAAPAAVWHLGATGFEEALVEAKTTGKPMAVYFYTNWCGYCREFKSDLLSAPEVGQYLSSVVAVQVNPEHGPREIDLARRFFAARQK